MKYVKMLGLLAVAAAALMAFAGTASATELTNAQGDKLGVGTEIHAESEGATSLTGTITITCQKSTVEGEVTNAGGAGITVSGHVSTLTFTECGNHTVTVKNAGSLEIHTEFEETGDPKTSHETAAATGNGTLTSTDAEVTVLLHSFLLGTVHCIYKTNETDIGTLTGSKNVAGKTATLDINSVSIPRVTTDSACGNHSTWEGSYSVTNPDYLDVD